MSNPSWLRSTAFACMLAVASAPAIASADEQKAAATPFATKAVVVVKSVDDKVVPLKREEQVALMFLSAITFLLDDCRDEAAAEPCTLEALVRGPKHKDGNQGMGRLKYDPRATDPNYAYKVTLSDCDWEVRVDPRKPGFGGFYAKGLRSFDCAPFDRVDGQWYNARGRATPAHTKIAYSITNDVFWGPYDPRGR